MGKRKKYSIEGYYKTNLVFFPTGGTDLLKQKNWDSEDVTISEGLLTLYKSGKLVKKENFNRHQQTAQYRTDPIAAFLVQLF